MRTLGHPLRSSSPISNPGCLNTSTASSVSSISAASDPLLHRPHAIRRNQNLRVLIANFQSLRPKKQELWNMLDSSNPDIILGTETWLRPDITNSEILPPTYDVYRRDRKDAHGGVLVAVRKSLISHQLPSNSAAEAVLVSIKTQDTNSNLIVGALYRPPSATSEEYTAAMTSVLDSACHSKRDVVWLGGDLNLPDIDWKTHSIGGSQYPRATNQVYLDKVQDAGLQQANHEPTRGGAILDVFLTNRPSLLSRIRTIPGLSDHDIVMADSNIQPARTKPIRRTVHIWKKADTQAMRRDIESLTDKILNTSPADTTVQETWEHIHTSLTKTLEDHVPKKYCSTKAHQPWVNATIKRLSRRKNRAWKKAKRTQEDHDWQRFKTLQRDTRKACRAAHSKYVSELLTEEGDSKRMWSYIKTKKCDATGVAPLKKAGLTYSDPSMKANILNEQFCSVFTEEDVNNLPDLGESPHPSMPDIEISTDGVLKLLNNLNPRKAAGPDNIPCRLLSAVAQEIAPALAYLFRLSLASGTIPEVWRHATVQPAFKKGDRSSPANYRPISLTSVCGKLCEHIVRSALTSHLDRNNILDNAQHGFRKRRSCETQLILTVDDLEKVLDEGGQTDTILLDFSKAFDKVPHQRLLLKLHFYGVRGQTLHWIRSFLSNRSQQVVVEGQASSIGHVTSGVPQGSVLGPILFLIYINDIGNDINSTVRLFADDTILYRQIKTQCDTHTLQEDLEKLAHWEKQWQMQFNASKCHVLTVTRKRTPICGKYTLHGEELQRVDKAKYLGVELTKDLHWGAHVQATSAKANKTSAFAYRNLRGCPHLVQSTCFKGLVRPILEYAAPVWDPYQKHLSASLEMVQRRSARRILHDFRPTSSATELVSRLKLDPLKLRRTATKATMMYKVMNGLVEVDPREGTLKPALRATRGHTARLQVPHSRTESHKFSFFPSAIRLWNTIPTEAATASSAQAFKSNIETWLRKNIL